MVEIPPQRGPFDALGASVEREPVEAALSVIGESEVRKTAAAGIQAAEQVEVEVAVEVEVDEFGAAFAAGIDPVEMGVDNNNGLLFKMSGDSPSIRTGP